MPIYANRIVFGEDPEDPADYYAFEDMVGRLQPKARQLEVMVRPGHPGETLRNTGTRAIPSQIQTMHFVEDWDAAAAAITAYNELRNGAPVEVIQHSTSYGYFRVVEVVELPQTRYSVNNLGALLANTTVQQYCLWTLIGTDPPEDP